MVVVEIADATAATLDENHGWRSVGRVPLYSLESCPGGTCIEQLIETESSHGELHERRSLASNLAIALAGQGSEPDRILELRDAQYCLRVIILRFCSRQLDQQHSRVMKP